ncbi:hypothetical protein ACI2K4_15055 [Micromonospora sp. NPDC050397]|uniref:hypothetical protein n=1 Tax=Micromonospora sp. NPDC050397 TaxID=3364279 RepID=UPI003850683A
MPAGDDTEQPRRRQLLTTLFRVGLGLAALAALMLLFGGSNGLLRMAGVLTVLAVVSIGLSITLRGDVQTVRPGAEGSLDEIERLRRSLREEVAGAARATHQSLGGQLQAMQQNIEALRHQLDAVRLDGSSGRGNPGAGPVDGAGHTSVPGRASAAVPDFRGGAPAAHPADAGRAVPGHRREPVRPEAYAGQDGYAGRDAYAGQDGYAARSASYEAGPQQPEPYRSGPYDGSGQYGAGRFSGAAPGPAHAGGERGGRAGGAPAGGAAPPRPHLGGGVVRHTETVKVTTRQTIVGPPGGDGGAGHEYGNGYGGGSEYGNAYGGANVYGGRGYVGDAHHGPGDAYPADTGRPTGDAYGGRGEREAEWSERPGRRRRATGPGDGPENPWPRERPRAEERGAGRYDPAEPDDAGSDDDPRWSGRSGDRWASVRTDERGSELRMGERRAAVRADESGTEMRVEDRWASMRRDEPRREQAWREDSQREQAWREEPRREEAWREDSQREQAWREEPRREEAWRGDSRWEEPGRPGARSADDPAGTGRRANDHWSGADAAAGAGGYRDARWPQTNDPGDPHWPGTGRPDAAPALPPAPAGAGTGWSGPPATPVQGGRRRAEDHQAYGYPPDDDAPRAGGARWR